MLGSNFSIHVLLNEEPQQTSAAILVASDPGVIIRANVTTSFGIDFSAASKIASVMICTLVARSAP